MRGRRRGPFRLQEIVQTPGGSVRAPCRTQRRCRCWKQKVTSYGELGLMRAPGKCGKWALEIHSAASGHK